MYTTFTTDCRYDNSIIELIENVYCPHTMCSGTLFVHKKFFQSLGRSNYHCRHSLSIIQVHNIPFEEQKNSLSLTCCHGVYIFWRDTKISPRCYWSYLSFRRYRSKYLSLWIHAWKLKDENCYDSLQRKAWCFHALNIPFNDEKPKNLHLAVMAVIDLSGRRVLTTRTINHFPFWRNFSAKHSPAHLKKSQKTQELFQFWYNRVNSSLVGTVNIKVHSLCYKLLVYNLQFTEYTISKTAWLSQSLMTVFSGLSTLNPIQLLGL